MNYVYNKPKRILSIIAGAFSLELVFLCLIGALLNFCTVVTGGWVMLLAWIVNLACAVLLIIFGIKAIKKPQKVGEMYDAKKGTYIGLIITYVCLVVIGIIAAIIGFVSVVMTLGGSLDELMGSGSYDEDYLYGTVSDGVDETLLAFRIMLAAYSLYFQIAIVSAAIVPLALSIVAMCLKTNKPVPAPAAATQAAPAAQITAPAAKAAPAAQPQQANDIKVRYPIVAGKIVPANLAEMGKSEEWLLEKLGCDAAGVAEYLLVEYDPLTDTLFPHKKNAAK